VAATWYRYTPIFRTHVGLPHHSPCSERYALPCPPKNIPECCREVRARCIVVSDDVRLVGWSDLVGRLRNLAEMASMMAAENTSKISELFRYDKHRETRLKQHGERLHAIEQQIGSGRFLRGVSINERLNAIEQPLEKLTKYIVSQGYYSISGITNRLRDMNTRLGQHNERLEQLACRLGTSRFVSEKGLNGRLDEVITAAASNSERLHDLHNDVAVLREANMMRGANLKPSEPQTTYDVYGTARWMMPMQRCGTRRCVVLWLRWSWWLQRRLWWRSRHGARSPGGRLRVWWASLGR